MVLYEDMDALKNENDSQEAETQVSDATLCEKDLPKEKPPKLESVGSVRNLMLLEAEAEARLKSVKPVAQQLLTIYDKLEFQYNRFKKPDALPIPKENQLGFFCNLNESIEKDALKASIIVDELTLVIGRYALELCRLESGFSNEQMESCFAELLANIESMALERDLHFMRLTETCEELVTCLEVEESDENRTELIRRGLVYKDSELEEFVRPIRYQEIKIYKLMEENKHE